jgi:NADPH:quinone reductase-like Zn-dependent oxidoreductase
MKMQAIVQATYGAPDVLELREVDAPEPNENEVRVKVQASSANAGDWHLLRGSPFAIRLSSGLRRPKHTILGADVAGEVEVTGSSVTRFQPGDAVFGDLSDSGFGGFAEYACAPETALAAKPDNLTFEEAAAVPSAALTALQGRRDHRRIQAGQQVLINGAAGGVGTFAVQIAKSFGAEVTGVCSTRNVALVRSIGADHVVDYTQDDFTRHGPRYDLILDAAAYRSLEEHQRALWQGGAYVLVGGSGRRYFEIMLKGPRLSRKGDQRFGTFVKQARQEDLAFLKDLLDSGKVVPVIDRRYPSSDVPEAIRYLEQGHAQGKVVITV